MPSYLSKRRGTIGAKGIQVLLFDDIFKPAPETDQVYAEILTAKDKKVGVSGVQGAAGRNLILWSELPARVSEIRQLAVGARQHVWYRPALRTSRGRVIGSWCLWADIDLKDNADAAKMIEAFSIAPSYIYYSGGGYHLIWLLDDFCADLKVLESKQFGIAAALKADFNAAGVKNGLRVPDTYNWKYYTPEKKPQEYACAMVYGEPLNVYAIDDFPDGQKPKSSKKSNPDAPGSFRELFAKYFASQVQDQAKEEWYVICPFHDDSNPSMSVNVEKGLYICGGCGAKGTAQDFYRRMEGITWAEAKKILEHLKNRSSMIDLMEEHLRGLGIPVYRDGYHIMLVQKRPNGATGKFMDFNIGSRTGIRGMLGVLFDGSPAQQATDAVGDVIPIKAMNEILEEAALQLGQSLPHKEDIRLLGQGIHYEDDQILMVDGSSMYQWDGITWVEIKEPIFENRWVAYNTEDDPKSWYPHGIESKPIEAKTILDAYEYILKENWVWSNSDDATMLALYSIYLPNWNMFGTPIHLQLSGESQSGKSSIAEGWFPGRLRGSVQMVQGMHYFTNISAAYLYQMHDNSTKPVVLDEILDHDDRRSKDLIELIRNMESGGSPVRRGTADGRKGKVYNAMFPTVWSSIKIPDTMQDVNRRLHIHMPRVEPPPDPPWSKIRSLWPVDKLEKLSKRAAMLVVENSVEISNIYKELQRDMKAITGSGHRMAYRLLPLIAIAKFCGRDITELLKRMVERVRIIEESTLEASPAERVRQDILFKPFQILGFDGQVTMASLIGQPGMNDVNAINEGMYYWRGLDELGIVTSRFQMAHFNLRDTSTMNLGRMLKNLPGYKTRETRRINGAVVAIHLFDARKLLNGAFTEPAKPSTIVKITRGESKVEELQSAAV